VRTIDKSKIVGEQEHEKRPTLRLIILSALSALGAGLVASLVASLVMSFLRLVAGIPTPVELFGDHVLKTLTVGQFIQLLIRFSPTPKTTPLGLALLAMVGLGSALGLLYALITRAKLPAASARPARKEWLVAAGLALAMTLVGGILFWGEIAQNLYGLPLQWAMLATLLGLLMEFGCYAVVLCLAYRVLLPRQPARAGAASDSGAAEQQARNNRRQLLARAGVAVLGVGAAGGSLGLIKGFFNNNASYDGMETFPTKNGFIAPITPNNEHYVVTQNIVDPIVNAGLWRLEVTGLVAHPGTYTLDELQAMPSTSRRISRASTSPLFSPARSICVTWSRRFCSFCPPAANGGRCRGSSRRTRRSRAISMPGATPEGGTRSSEPWFGRHGGNSDASRARRVPSSTAKVPKGPPGRMPAGSMGEKKVTGRKRHIVVDTVGHLLTVIAHPANIADSTGADWVLEAATAKRWRTRSESSRSSRCAIEREPPSARASICGITTRSCWVPVRSRTTSWSAASRAGSRSPPAPRRSSGPGPHALAVAYRR